MPISTKRNLEIHQSKNLKDFVRDQKAKSMRAAPPRPVWASQPASAPMIPGRSSSITDPVGI